MAEIPIYGTLVNATTDPKIVNTDQAWDNLKSIKKELRAMIL